MDPFSGNVQDPLSLHKYLYVHGNPINGIDPFGLSFLSEMGEAIHKQIFAEYDNDHMGQDILHDKALRFRPGWIRPDVANYTEGKIGEIKPFSAWGFATGELQVTAGLAFANGISFHYRGYDFPILPRVPHGGPPGDWIKEDWQPGVRIIYPGQVNARFQNWIAVTLFNVDGVIYYKRLYVPRPATLLVFSLLMLKEKVDAFVDDMIRDVRLGLDYGTELVWNYRLEAAKFVAVGAGLVVAGIALVSLANAARGLSTYSTGPSLSFNFT